MTDVFLKIGLVFLTSAILVFAVRWCRLKFSLHPEISRKMLHLGTCLIGLSFIFLFDRLWPVILILSIAIVLPLSIPYSKNIDKLIGGILGGTERKPYGVAYGIIAIAILFVLAGGDPVLYGIPIVILALADLSAALVGIYYGHFHYTTMEGEKSAEGSIAFFVVAFFTVNIPLVLFTTVGRTETLLISLILAFLMMIFEAISWKGLDNFLIPLVSFLLLKTFIPMEASTLLNHLIIITCLVAFVFIWHKRTTLDDSAFLGFALSSYACWALGGWRWLIAPFIFIITYPHLRPGSTKKILHDQHINAVLSVCFAALFWLFLAKTGNHPELIYPFTICLGAHLAMIGVARFKSAKPQLHGLVILGLCTLISWLVLFMPYVVTEGIKYFVLKQFFWALPCIAFSAVAFFFIQPNLASFPSGTSRWLRQAFLSLVASAMGLIPLYII